MQEKQFLFTGVYNYEGKSIVSGIKVYPEKTNSLTLTVEVLQDWELVEEYGVQVYLDEVSAEGAKYFISDTIPAYRFFNGKGYELFLAKETHFDYYLAGDPVQKHSSELSWLKFILPPKSQHLISKLPVMHLK